VGVLRTNECFRRLASDVWPSASRKSRTRIYVCVIVITLQWPCGECSDRGGSLGGRSSGNRIETSFSRARRKFGSFGKSADNDCAHLFQIGQKQCVKWSLRALSIIHHQRVTTLHVSEARRLFFFFWICAKLESCTSCVMIDKANNKEIKRNQALIVYGISQLIL